MYVLGEGQARGDEEKTEVQNRGVFNGEKQNSGKQSVSVHRSTIYTKTSHPTNTHTKKSVHPSKFPHEKHKSKDNDSSRTRAILKNKNREQTYDM